MTEEKLKNIVRETVKEVFDEYMDKIKLEIILANTPYVSDEEQKELEDLFGEKPVLDDIMTFMKR